MHLFISQKDGIQDIQMMGFKKVNVNLPKASARGFPPGHRHVDPSKLTSPTHRKKHQTSGSEASRRQQLLPIKEFENLNQFHQWTSADWWVDGFGGFMGWWVDGLGWVTWIQEKLGQEWDKATSPGLAGKSLHRTRLDSFKGRKMIVENRWNRWYHDNLMIIPVFIIPTDEAHKKLMKSSLQLMKFTHSNFFILKSQRRMLQWSGCLMLGTSEGPILCRDHDASFGSLTNAYVWWGQTGQHLTLPDSPNPLFLIYFYI